MRKDFLRTLFSRMLATYMTVTLGLLLLSGVVIGALMSGFVMREQKQDVANEIAVVSELYFNTTAASVGENAAILELNTIARHYDALIQIISLDGTMAQYASGSKWDSIMSTRYTEEEITRMLNAVSDLDSSSVRFTQQKTTFQMLIGSRPLLEEGVATHVIRFYVDITEARGAVGMAYMEVILVSLIAVLISVIVVYYTTTRLTRPFMEINEIVQKYSKGDYNVRIPISSIEEATQLAISFNTMADQLKDLEATRRSFVANVSHELRSPLTSMKGFLEAMQDGTIGPDEYEKYIGIVLSETKRMAVMVNDLLDLARIESGKTALKLEIFDINELIRRTLITFEARIYEHHMEVDVKFAQEQYYVEADSAQISQVLRNIIDNAIKYSPDDSKLRIATYAMKREIYVSIQDSGQGIPEQDIPHVFDRFYKVEKAHTPSKQSGTGLGLSIVKRIIDQHNQTITLKSAKGKGSTFTFTLKRAPAPKRALTDGGKKNGI
ncbi:Adaptive-response sensory-kinase SasA [bioreactor metagenome]|uniref:histidine kinase n=1 Tax=bioreactor metagenome TaxID=1076179 RepID=A0A644XEZ7_9ZZZZ